MRISLGVERALSVTGEEPCEGFQSMDVNVQIGAMTNIGMTKKGSVNSSCSASHGNHTRHSASSKATIMALSVRLDGVHFFPLEPQPHFMPIGWSKRGLPRRYIRATQMLQFWVLPPPQ